MATMPFGFRVIFSVCNHSRYVVPSRSAIVNAGKKLSHVLGLLRFSRPVEYQKNGVQCVDIYSNFIPTSVEVIWSFIVSDEASINIDSAAACSLQVLQRASQTNQELPTPITVSEPVNQLVPRSPMDARREESIAIEWRNHNITIYGRYDPVNDADAPGTKKAGAAKDAGLDSLGDMKGCYRLNCGSWYSVSLM